MTSAGLQHYFAVLTHLLITPYHLPTTIKPLKLKQYDYYTQDMMSYVNILQAIKSLDYIAACELTGYIYFKEEAHIWHLKN